MTRGLKVKAVEIDGKDVTREFKAHSRRVERAKARSRRSQPKRRRHGRHGRT